MRPEPASHHAASMPDPPACRTKDSSVGN
jgi:hypothetical protein